jgi:hypothetical protein
MATHYSRIKASHGMNEEKVNAAVEKCLKEALTSGQPFFQIEGLVWQLRRSPDWTTEEIYEVQKRAVSQLARDRGLLG